MSRNTDLLLGIDGWCHRDRTVSHGGLTSRLTCHDLTIEDLLSSNNHLHKGQVIQPALVIRGCVTVGKEKVASRDPNTGWLRRVFLNWLVEKGIPEPRKNCTIPTEPIFHNCIYNNRVISMCILITNSSDLSLACSVIV